MIGERVSDWDGGSQMAVQLGETLLGSAASPAGFDLGEARRNEPTTVVGMVEGDYPVVQADGQIGDREFIDSRPRQPFEVVAEVVAEQTGGATLERRQAR